MTATTFGQRNKFVDLVDKFLSFPRPARHRFAQAKQAGSGNLTLVILSEAKNL
jgi:hypothetical protein